MEMKLELDDMKAELVQAGHDVQGDMVFLADEAVPAETSLIVNPLSCPAHVATSRTARWTRSSLTIPPTPSSRNLIT